MCPATPRWSNPTKRSTAAALLLLLFGLAGCSSDDTTTPAADDGPDPTEGPAEVDTTDPATSLASLDGTWRVKIGKLGVESTSGLLDTSTVRTSLDDNVVMMTWEGTLPSGEPHIGSSGNPLPFTGDIELECGESDCTVDSSAVMWFPAIMATDGQLRVVSLASEQPPTSPCFDDPEGAWDVAVLDDSTLEILGTLNGGSGGDDGCQDAFQVAYTMTLTRGG